MVETGGAAAAAAPQCVDEGKHTAPPVQHAQKEGQGPATTRQPNGHRCGTHDAYDVGGWVGGWVG